MATKPPQQIPQFQFGQEGDVAEFDQSQIQSIEQENKAELKAIDDGSWGSALNAAWENSFVGSAVRQYSINSIVDEFEKDAKDKGSFDSNWTPDYTKYIGLTDGEIEELDKATTQGSFDAILSSQETRRREQAALASKGMGVAMGLSVLASAPESLIAGIGVGGAVGALANAGRLGATLRGSMAVRGAVANIGSGLATTGAQFAIDPYTESGDLAVGLVADMVLSAPAAFKSVSHFKGDITDTLKEAGVDFEYSRPVIDGKELSAHDLTHSDSQLNRMTETPIIPDSTPINQYKHWSDLGTDFDGHLTAEGLVKGIEEHKATLIDFEDEFKPIPTKDLNLSADAIGKEAYDAVMSGAYTDDLGNLHLKQQSARSWIEEHNAQGSLFKQSKESPVIATKDIDSRMVEAADIVSRKYLGGQKVVIVSGEVDGARATMTNLEGGIIGITLSKPAQWSDLLHELGHAASRKALADVNIPNSLKADYIRGLKNIAINFHTLTSADDFESIGKAARARFGSGTIQAKAVVSEVSKEKYGNVEIGETDKGSILDRTVTVLSNLFDRWRGNKLKDENYTGSLDEIGAVSFQRYISNQFKLKKVKVNAHVSDVLADTYRNTNITHMQVDKDINQFAFGTESVHGALDDVSLTESSLFSKLEESSTKQLEERTKRSVDELKSRNLDVQYSEGKNWVASADGYNRGTTSPLAYVQETEVQKKSIEFEYGIRNSGTTRAEVEQSNTAVAWVRKAWNAGVDQRLSDEEAYKSLLSPRVTPDVVEDKMAKQVLKQMGTHSGVSVMDGIATQFASPSLIMSQSKNPAVRYAGKLLAEDPSGITGKRVRTAAIVKDVTSKKLVGDFRRVDNHAYRQWLKDEGSLLSGFVSEEKRVEFNRLVSTEVQNIINGGDASTGPIGRAAKNVIAMGERIKQVHKPLAEKAGVAEYVSESKNPIPKILKREALQHLDPSMREAIGKELRDRLTEAAAEFGEVLDKTTARKWAEKLLNHGSNPSQGGNFRMMDSSVHFNSSGIELEEFLDDVEVFGQPKEAELSKVNARRKARMAVQLKALDLVNYDIPINNQGMKLSDLFETDYATALMRQAESLSGVAAVNAVGIPSWKHLDFVRYALESGKAEYAATKTELKAFDQVVAELKGERPEFANNIPTLDAVGSLTSSSLLGGSTFAQMAEFSNVVNQFGFATTLKHFPEIKTMMSEVRKLARGEKLGADSVLSRFEDVSGTVVGMDGYFSRTLFDKMSGVGADRYTDVDRFNKLAGSLSHANIVFSGQRLVSAVQERMASQMALSHIFDVVNGKTISKRAKLTLEAAGMTEEKVAKWKAALEGKMDFQNGIYGFASKEVDHAVIDEIQEVMIRHASQTIQRGLIGETGAWQHNSLIRSALQFRGYGLVATEKQLLRQLDTIGLGGWMAALVKGMAMAAPVYIIRQHVNSIGRDDREEFVNKMLSHEEMIPNLFNMVSNAGALFDLGATAKTVLIGSEFNRDTIGGAFFPAVTYVNDTFSAVRKGFNGDFAAAGKSATRLLPFANNPLFKAAGNIVRSNLDDSK